jgi:ABC-type multidrug transport system fused ATPase/permease subunit
MCSDYAQLCPIMPTNLLKTRRFAYYAQRNAGIFCLALPGGSTAALVGKSGGGKTTVISLLLRYYDVKGGSIAFDGLDLRSLNLSSVHKNIGLVMQAGVYTRSLFDSM